MIIEHQKLKDLIEQSDNIVFFGGAGVSTESGVKDFRSPDGIYNMKFKYVLIASLMLAILVVGAVMDLGINDAEAITYLLGVPGFVVAIIGFIMTLSNIKGLKGLKGKAAEIAKKEYLDYITACGEYNRLVDEFINNRYKEIFEEAEQLING